MDDPNELIRRRNRALMALLTPLAVGALLVGLAPLGGGGSPAHPKCSAEPCAAPRPIGESSARRTEPLPARTDSAARRRALVQRIDATLEETSESPPEISSEWRLLHLLVDLQLDAGRLQSALDSLSDGDAAASLWMHAGWRLENGGQLELAQRAFREALQRDPGCNWALDELKDVDPAAALAAVERRPIGTQPSALSTHVALRARLLAACDRRDDAVAALRSVPDDAVRGCDIDFWRVFDELAPLESAQRRERLALTGQDADALADHVRQLAWQGDGAAAIALLSRTWLVDEVADTALQLLCELDPVHAEDTLRSALQLQPERADLWQLRGDSAFAHGNLETALDAWMRALTIDPWACDDYERLWQHRREPFLQAFWQGALRVDSDWIWEECGDWMWRSGRSQEALDAWSQAVRLEPDDEGTLAKIERARSGLWPL